MPVLVRKTVNAISEQLTYDESEGGSSWGTLVNQRIKDSLEAGEELVAVAVHFTPEEWAEIAADFRKGDFDPMDK